MNEIHSMLKGTYDEVDGVLIPEAEGEKTVWDNLASKNLLDAATSATSEEHAQEKGRTQIEGLKAEANGGVILDLGCGYGRIAEGLLPERSFEAYIGLDSSRTMLTTAHRRKKGNSQIDTPMYWLYGRIDDIPLQDASVDTVVVSAVFLHNHKDIVKRSIEEAHRVLKPGGKLFVYSSFPNFHSLMGYQGALYLFFMGIVGDPYRNGPVRYYSKEEVSRLFANFAKTEVQPYGFALLPKRVLIFPGTIGSMYRTVIANPVNRCFERLCSDQARTWFPTHHDVVAIK